MTRFTGGRQLFVKVIEERGNHKTAGMVSTAPRESCSFIKPQPVIITKNRNTSLKAPYVQDQQRLHLGQLFLVFWTNIR